MNASCLFDAHCDTLMRCWETGESLLSNAGAVDLARLGAFGRSCQVFALFAQDSMDPAKGSEQICREELDILLRAVSNHPDRIALCRSGADIRRANREGRVAALVSVEGAHSLGCSIETLRAAYAVGVRAVNITWNNANILSGSHCEEPERGLSPEGRAFVAEMGRLGMLPDVSHLSDPGFWDVVEVSAVPVIASHSNSRAVCPNTRNLTDAQFTAIIKRQGIVGLNLCREFVGLGEDVDGLVAHLEHFLALGGEHTVALGGDLDGCGPIAGIPDCAHWPALWEALARRNYKESLLEDLFYNNLMRVVDQL